MAITISNHAESRFKERFPGRIETLQCMYKKSKKIKAIDAKKLGIKPARKGRQLRRHHECMLVVKRNCNVIITVFRLNQSSLREHRKHKKT